MGSPALSAALLLLLAALPVTAHAQPEPGSEYVYTGVYEGRAATAEGEAWVKCELKLRVAVEDVTGESVVLRAVLEEWRCDYGGEGELLEELGYDPETGRVEAGPLTVEPDEAAEKRFVYSLDNEFDEEDALGGEIPFYVSPDKLGEGVFKGRETLDLVFANLTSYYEAEYDRDTGLLERALVEITLEAGEARIEQSVSLERSGGLAVPPYALVLAAAVVLAALAWLKMRPAA